MDIYLGPGSLTTAILGAIVLVIFIASRRKYDDAATDSGPDNPEPLPPVRFSAAPLYNLGGNLGLRPFAARLDIGCSICHSVVVRKVLYRQEAAAFTWSRNTFEGVMESGPLLRDWIEKHAGWRPQDEAHVRVDASCCINCGHGELLIQSLISTAMGFIEVPGKFQSITLSPAVTTEAGLIPPKAWLDHQPAQRPAAPFGTTRTFLAIELERQDMSTPCSSVLIQEWLLQPYDVNT